jgi:hypothetical protein
VPDDELHAAVNNQIKVEILRELYTGGDGEPSDLKEQDSVVRKRLKGYGVNWPVSMETVRRASERRVDKPRRRK